MPWNYALELCPGLLAGLGDVAVPGLLAGLALRYDASRATDMNGRARAAGAAMMESLETLEVRPRAHHGLQVSTSQSYEDGASLTPEQLYLASRPHM